MSLPDEKYKALACFMTLDVALKGVDGRANGAVESFAD